MRPHLRHEQDCREAEPDRAVRSMVLSYPRQPGILVYISNNILRGCGGCQVVSKLALYSDESSLIPVELNNFFVVKKPNQKPFTQLLAA